ncbi:MAG: hypothetical protein KDA61_14855, partial [Planctomycetales bacterium]|nr:hypothetical protein [Planctomycetales bacterium]
MVKEFQDTWTLREGRADLHVGTLHGTLPLDDLAKGLTDLRAGDASFPGRTLSVHAGVVSKPQMDWRLIDVYTRQRTLSTRYTTHAEPSLTLHIDWRVVEDDALANAAKTERTYVAFDWSASLQTQQLGVAPRLELASELPPGRVWLRPTDAGNGAETWREKQPGSCFDGRAVTLTIDGAEWTYAELAYVGDLQGISSPTQTDAASTATSRWLFEGETLEKGVIRCLRLRCAWWPGAFAAERLEEERRRFAAAPPPLTT